MKNFTRFSRSPTAPLVGDNHTLVLGNTNAVMELHVPNTLLMRTATTGLRLGFSGLATASLTSTAIQGARRSVLPSPAGHPGHTSSRHTCPGDSPTSGPLGPLKLPWPTQVNCPNVLVVHLHLLNLHHVQNSHHAACDNPRLRDSPRKRSKQHCRRTLCLMNHPNLP